MVQQGLASGWGKCHGRNMVSLVARWEVLSVWPNAPLSSGLPPPSLPELCINSSVLRPHLHPTSTGWPTILICQTEFQL